MTFPQAGDTSHQTTLAVVGNALLIDVLLPVANKVAPDHSLEIKIEWRQVDRGGSPHIALTVHITKDELTKWIQSDPLEFETEHDFVHTWRKLLGPLVDQFEDAVLDLVREAG